MNDNSSTPKPNTVKRINGRNAYNGTLPLIHSPGGVSNALPTQEADAINKAIVAYTQGILDDGRKESGRLCSRLNQTYWILIDLTVLMYLVGIVLITAPIWGPLFRKDMTWESGFLTVGIGALDFVMLFLFRPLSRIQKAMGDMCQMIALLNSFHIRIALRLVEADSANRKTIGEAAEHIAQAASSTVELTEKYFEGWLQKDLGSQTGAAQ